MAELTLPRVKQAPRRSGAVRLLTRDPGTASALLLAAAFLLLGVLYPLFEILSQGFFASSGARRGEFDLAAYQSVLTRPVYQTIILNTLKLGMITAVLGTMLGFL